MCINFAGPINMEYVKDLSRGRAGDWGRFDKLQKYVYARWEKTRDMRHANQWRALMETIKRRKPY